MISKPTRISDGQCAHSEILSTSSAKFNVVSTVMMNTSLGQHGIVLNLRFPIDTKQSINFSVTTD